MRPHVPPLTPEEQSRADETMRLYRKLSELQTVHRQIEVRVTATSVTPRALTMPPHRWRWSGTEWVGERVTA